MIAEWLIDCRIGTYDKYFVQDENWLDFFRTAKLDRREGRSESI